MQDSFDSIRLALAVIVAGVLIGIMGGLFLLALHMADDGRVALIEVAVRHSFPGWLCAALAGLIGASIAAWMARRYAPDSSQVVATEVADATDQSASGISHITVNFAGASMAVGVGLALGPERPAIQMGGSIGRFVSWLMRLNEPDHELMMVATGSAGIATMFNSPLGCAAYAVEKVLKRVDMRTSFTALGTGAVAVAVVRLFLDRSVNFQVGEMADLQFQHLFLFLMLGCAIGILGYLQVWTIIFVATFFQHFPSTARGALVGLAVGLLAWYAPSLVGSGDALTQGVLDSKFVLSALAFMLLVRFFLGPLSMAASTPGGYFTPVLLLGALSGAIYGTLANASLPLDLPPASACALVGMGAALATITRAPFTGVLLAMETTGTYSLGLPMIMAVFGSAAVIYLLHSPTTTTGLELQRARLRQQERGRGLAHSEDPG